MKETSSDFMVEIVNHEAAMGATEVLLVVFIIALVAIGISWWIKRK